MVFRRIIFSSLFALSLLTLVCWCHSTAHAGCIYTGGHADMRISYADEALSLALGIDALTSLDCDVPLPPGTTHLDPSEVVTFVPESTAQIRSGLPSWDIVGVESGETFYRLPQAGLSAQIEGAPFLGLNTLDVPGGVFNNNQISLALTDVISAPEEGEFALYTGDTVPFREMDTQDGSFANDVVPLPSGIHDHRNWSFSKPGHYQLEFTAFGTLADGSESEISTTAVFTFQVTSVGDFNASGALDSNDIDLFVNALGGSDSLYDLDGSGLVDQTDFDKLIHDIFGSEFGDGNLDRAVDIGDFTLWGTGFGKPNPGWGDGDYNSDGNVDIGDFTLWGTMFGFDNSSPGPVPTPEPSTLLLALVAAGTFAMRRRVPSTRRP